MQQSNNYANMSRRDLERAHEQALQRERELRDRSDQEFERRRELDRELERRREEDRMRNPNCFEECERRCGNREY